MQSELEIFEFFFKATNMSPESEQGILNEILSNPKKTKHHCQDSGFIYCIKDLSVQQALQSRSRLNVRGQWESHDYKYEGHDTFSLVKKIKDCSDIEALNYVAKWRGIKLSNPGMLQEKWNGYECLLDSTAYSGNKMPINDRRCFGSTQ